MKKKHKVFCLILILAALAILSFITVFYIRQMDQTISDNIIGSISEIAEHDKTTIQTYIEICWEDLQEIHQRFVSHNCKTVGDIEERMNLERASSHFTHVYLLAEDGTVYTDKYVTYAPDSEVIRRSFDFLTFFANGEDKVVRRFDDKAGTWVTKESILYGIRLKDFQIEGKKMFALIGITDIRAIQDNMVIESFIKDGSSRGHSALIDMDGNYIVDVSKNIYLNQSDNLFEHLKGAEKSELTDEEVAEKLKNSETFGFYHSHEGQKNQELFYFIPLGEGTDLYFIMSVNEEVFMEQTREFATMSMAMLVFSILIVIIMLLIVMFYQMKAVRTTTQAKSQKEFLSNMSHEIRTPLNGIIGMNHLMMVHIDDEKQKSQIREWLKKTNSTANYLLSLVNDILDMSKLQAGKVDLINEPLMVEDMIDEICAMQADNIESRGVAFIVEKDIQAPCIEGDVTRIKQILMNIVGNAAKFTPAGGHIKLSVCQEKKDGTHIITIYRCEDTGVGISREYIGKIFDSFSQERNKNESGIKGTGLGMAISKLLANAMGGDITVESELDVGSTFTVAIPSAIVTDIPDYMREDANKEQSSSEKDSSEKSSDGADRPGSGSPIKILVAEDVELNAEVLLEILALEGFETVHARDGKEALDLFRESEPGEFDVILMDMQMPVMDGCTAAREIRKLDREDADSVVIYACTANTFQEDRTQAMESGMNDFLTKPIDVKVLLKKMDRIKG